MRDDLPTGTVTLLFSDVEGSTRLLAQHGDGYADVLAEHRRALRDAFAEHGGVEVDTQGDSFLVAFASATEAVEAARRAQGSSAIPVRIGLHTGEPAATEEGYVGADVHLGARIAAAAHGGQVLLSAITNEVAHADALDLGVYRLKDIEEPVQLFQLGGGAFPPPRTLRHGGIPTSPTPLVGRKKELADLVQLLGSGDARLVTLTGPGGIGKTRLAGEVGRELATRLLGGAWFVDLSALRDPASVVPTIASTLEVKGELEQYLRDRDALLVLDNLEQVIESAAAVAALSQACPGLRMLVTSREPLRVRGEHTYPLALLPEAPAVELFRQRASAVDPAFDAAYDLLAELCRRLDQLPLAIELAAARVTTLPADQLLARLEQRLPVLARGSRDLPERQRTLRAAIEWSYDLLDPDEQRVFTCLAVFAGGFTLDAAEHVCAAGLDTLESLVEKNLVRRRGVRFAMLATIREFARELLDARSDADDLALRHAEHYLAVAEQADREIHQAERLATHPDEEWFDLLAPEHDNIRAALRFLIDHEHGELALRLGFAVRSFWWRRDYVNEGARWLEEALASKARVPARARINGLYAHGQLAFFAGRSDDAEPSFTELVELTTDDDPRLLAAGYGGLASVARSRGDLDRARQLFRRVLEINERLEDRRAVYYSLHQLGEIARDEGEYGLASELLERAAAEARAFGQTMALPNTLHSLGDLALDRGELPRARELYAESLGLVVEFDSRSSIAYCLAGLAAVAFLEGDSTRAGRLWGAVEQVEESVGHRLLEFERERYARVLGDGQDPAFAAAEQAGRELTLEQAVAEALAAA